MIIQDIQVVGSRLYVNVVNNLLNVYNVDYYYQWYRDRDRKEKIKEVLKERG